MKKSSGLALLISLLTANAYSNTAKELQPMLKTVSPKLAQTKEFMRNELWQRTELSLKQRSLVTVAAMIARDQSTGLSQQIEFALDNGVTPKELSEVITHLAFYCGWGNAMTAVNATAPIYKKRAIKALDIEPEKLQLLPLNKASEAQRATFVSTTYGEVSPGVVQYTTDKLFKDLWLRTNLAPIDRSLITVAALVASGQSEQVPFHLNKAMDSGLTQTQASEILTQLAFYSGWPKAFSAMPVFKNVFASRK